MCRAILCIYSIISITLLVGCSDWEYIDNGDGTVTVTRYRGEDTKIQIPSRLGGKTVTTIRSQALCGLSIESVAIPEGIVRIGDAAFLDCKRLKSVTIPSTVEIIESWAFRNCTAMETVTISQGVSEIGSKAFVGCIGLTSIQIPDGVTKIGDETFVGCDRLQTVLLPKTLKSIGNYSFSYCPKLESILVDEDNPRYSSADGVLFSKHKTKLIRYPTGRFGETYEIPSTVTELESNAFADSNLKSITISRTLSLWGGNCFSRCAGLTTLSVASGETVKKPKLEEGFMHGEWNYANGREAFSECKVLRYVQLSPRSAVIGTKMFVGCSTLEKVEIPDGLIVIGPNAFAGCIALKSVSIPQSVTRIAEMAFADCTALEKVEVDSKKIKIDPSAFSGCTTLKTVPKSRQ